MHAMIPNNANQTLKITMSCMVVLIIMHPISHSVAPEELKKARLYNIIIIYNIKQYAVISVHSEPLDLVTQLVIKFNHNHYTVKTM